MINFDFSKHCTGCAACHDICPKKCIRMQRDRYDFIIPCVDNDSCVNCKKCENICPVLNTQKPIVERHVFMAYNVDVEERHYGSSGSVILPIAKYVILSGGSVYGAEFNENLQLVHSRETTYDGVLRQSKSKYLQSNTSGVFNSVKDDLNNGLKVLFVGTPCQVQALNNFIQKKHRSNLILVDFLCHGVPSQKLFDNAIHKYEVDNSCKVVGFSFREKSNTRLRNYKITFEKNNILYSKSGVENEFPFYCGYLKYYPFRESCYECKFANINRVSDLTIGDMWGMEWTGELKDFHKGYSLIYTNNSKGFFTLMQLKDTLVLKEFEIDDPRTENFTYKNKSNKTIEHKLFRLLYPYVSYEFIEQYFFADVNRRNRLQKFYFRTESVCLASFRRFYSISIILKQKFKDGIKRL